ncbi:MAG: NAD-binding protein [Symploca sp. SIO2E9]|nr:NAD-binding protein [Symploca sp. SIO2E9]
MISSLRTGDPDVFAMVSREGQRQNENIELIASANFVSRTVLEATGSLLTNKVAEGYPGRRYFSGCEYIDEIENLAIARAKKLFGATYVNIEPYSGSQANQAVYLSVLKPGDRLLSMDLVHGGHLSHGAKATMTGKNYDCHFYHVNPETERLDYDTKALGEVLSLGTEPGIDPKQLTKMIQAGSGSSWVAEKLLPSILEGNPGPAFALNLAYKDTCLVDELNKTFKTSLEFSDV